jgi:hypothetical protein
MGSSVALFPLLERWRSYHALMVEGPSTMYFPMFRLQFCKQRHRYWPLRRQSDEIMNRQSGDLQLHPR